MSGLATGRRQSQEEKSSSWNLFSGREERTPGWHFLCSVLCLSCLGYIRRRGALPGRQTEEAFCDACRCNLHRSHSMAWTWSYSILGLILQNICWQSENSWPLRKGAKASQVLLKNESPHSGSLLGLSFRAWATLNLHIEQQLRPHLRHMSVG